jgi:hypothetical protein
VNPDTGFHKPHPTREHRNKGIWTSTKRSSLRNRQGTPPEQLEVFALQNRGFELLKADNLKDVLLTLQENRIDSLVLDAALLAEDCGFISVIKGNGEGPAHHRLRGKEHP